MSEPETWEPDGTEEDVWFGDEEDADDNIVMIGVPGLAYNIFIGAIILGMMALHSWMERRHNAGD